MQPELAPNHAPAPTACYAAREVFVVGQVEKTSAFAYEAELSGIRRRCHRPMIATSRGGANSGWPSWSRLPFEGCRLVASL